MPSEPHSEHPRPWNEKNQFVSGLLAYMIPGAGHFYQGRWFKGCIYSICILATFFGGMRLGEGAVVYHVPNNSWGISLNYLAQVCVGLPALPAWEQARRAKKDSNRKVYELSKPLNAPFSGELQTIAETGRSSGQLEGVVELSTTTDGPLPETRGVFRGTLDGQPIELPLLGGFELDRPISAGFRRPLDCNVARQADQHPHETHRIHGTIPRDFLDAYCAPPEPEKLKDLHGRLGKFYDLAIAFTMIAGLLNVLAIWDAIEGPAYGFGDEVLPEQAESKDAGAAAIEPEPATAAAATEPVPARKS